MTGNGCVEERLQNFHAKHLVLLEYCIACSLLPYVRSVTCFWGERIRLVVLAHTYTCN